MEPYVESARKAYDLKTELEKLLPMKSEDDKRLWKKFRLEWNYNSNHIEGNTLTYHETELYLIFGRTTGDHLKREYDEMGAHDAAVELVREWAQDNTRFITEKEIRELNKIILVEPYYKRAETPDGKETEKLIEPGQYKQSPNSVRLPSGEMHPFVSPEDTPARMQKLMETHLANPYKNSGPFQYAAEFHHEFVQIHPFDDGNGRVARLLMNYILMREGYPPVIIKSADKQNYYAALQKADAGDRTAFMQYISDQLVWSLELSMKAAKGEDITEAGDIDKEFDLLKRVIKKDKFLQQKKDAEISFKVLKEVIVPFFEEINSSLIKVDDMFLEHYAHVDIPLPNFGFTADLLDPGFAGIKSKIREIETNSQYNNSLQKVSLNIRWNGFSHSRGARNVYLDFDVYFNEYHYILNSNNRAGRTSIEKFYHESITNEEKELLISELKKEVYDEIKRLSGITEK